MNESVEKNGRTQGGVNESVEKKSARNGLTWAGQIEVMGYEKLAKRADAQKVEGERRRDRPTLRWGGGCIKRPIKRGEIMEKEQ